MNLKWISLGGLAILLVAVLALLARHALAGSGPVAIAAQVGAVALMLAARLTLGRRSFHAAANPTEGGVVTTGPYRFIRHPIYAAILLFVVAAVASHPSWINLALGLIAAAGVAVRIACEERLLVARYPDYAGYAARTKRVVPWLV